MTGEPLPDMAHARLRLERAHVHADELFEEIIRYERGNPYSAIADERPDEQGQFCYRLHIEPEPPVAWAMLLGDAVHNARAALDYAVVAMAVASFGHPLTDDDTRHLQFPLWTEPRRVAFKTAATKAPASAKDTSVGRLWGLREEFVDRVELVQPYNGWKYAFADDSVLVAQNIGPGNFLARLDRLSNQEKHRRLPLVVADLRGGHVASSAVAESGLSVRAWAGPGCPPLGEGCVLATAPSRGLGATIAPTAVIAIEDEPGGQPREVAALLPAILAEVSNVLLYLETGEVDGEGWR